MHAVKAIYHDGIIELIEKPLVEGTAEVLVIFPEKQKKVVKIGGLFKGQSIDYAGIETDLKQLNHAYQKHLLDEAND